MTAIRDFGLALLLERLQSVQVAEVRGADLALQVQAARRKTRIDLTLIGRVLRRHEPQGEIIESESDALGPWAVPYEKLGFGLGHVVRSRTVTMRHVRLAAHSDSGPSNVLVLKGGSVALLPTAALRTLLGECGDRIALMGVAITWRDRHSDCLGFAYGRSSRGNELAAFDLIADGPLLPVPARLSKLARRLQVRTKAAG